MCRVAGWAAGCHAAADAGGGATHPPPPPPAQPHAVRNGHIKRITDSDIQSSVLEIAGVNVSTTYITCPADPKRTLGIKLPFLVMIIKNLKKRVAPAACRGGGTASPGHDRHAQCMCRAVTTSAIPLALPTQVLHL